MGSNKRRETAETERRETAAPEAHTEATQLPVNDSFISSLPSSVWLLNKCRVGFKSIECPDGIKVRVRWFEDYVAININGEKVKLTYEDFYSIVTGVDYRVKQLNWAYKLQMGDEKVTATPCWDKSGNRFFVVRYDNDTTDRKPIIQKGDTIFMPGFNASLCPHYRYIRNATEEEFRKANADLLKNMSHLPSDVRHAIYYAIIYGFAAPLAEQRPILGLWGPPGIGKTTILKLVAAFHDAYVVEGYSPASIRNLLTWQNLIADDVLESTSAENMPQLADLILAYFNRHVTARVYTTGAFRRFYLRGSLWMAGANLLEIINYREGIPRRLRLYGLFKKVTPVDINHIYKDIEYYMALSYIVAPRKIFALDVLLPENVSTPTSLVLDTAMSVVGIDADAVLKFEETYETPHVESHVVSLLQRTIQQLRKAKATPKYAKPPYLIVFTNSKNIPKRLSTKATINEDAKVVDGKLVKVLKVTREAQTYTTEELVKIFRSLGLPLEIKDKAVVVEDTKLEEAMTIACMRLKEMGGTSPYCQ
ncbi:MAG: hypothetical protein QW328_07375 [Nitrososphaerota archaeon]